jgi:hypothetical protein
MAWIVEFTDEFEGWWSSLSEAVQDAIDRVVGVLEQRGAALPFPLSSDVQGSKYGNMRELRVQVAGDPYRIFYAFDPRRVAILLIGGCKTGEGQFYERMIPIADRIYDEHLEQLSREARGEEQ